MKEQLTNSILGGYQLGQFLGFIFWAFVGAFILMMIHAQARNVKSYRTPLQFSWTVWLMDNLGRILFNVILIVFVVRFSKEITTHEVTDFWAAVIGLSADGLAQMVQKFNLLQLIGSYSKPAPDPTVDSFRDKPTAQ